MLKVNGLEITTCSTKERLVKGISFEVGKGETLGLIGESGSGKSLTSKAVMQLLNRRVFTINGSIKWKNEEMLRKNAKLPKGWRGQQIANEYVVYNSDKIGSYTFNSIPNHVDVAAIKLK